MRKKWQPFFPIQIVGTAILNFGKFSIFDIIDVLKIEVAELAPELASLIRQIVLSHVKLF